MKRPVQRRGLKGFLMDRSELPGRITSNTHEPRHLSWKSTLLCFGVVFLILFSHVAMTSMVWGHLDDVVEQPPPSTGVSKDSIIPHEIVPGDSGALGGVAHQRREGDHVIHGEKEAPDPRRQITHPIAPDAVQGNILVLGMHHSGTSIVTKLLLMMGVYGGQTSDLLMLPGNRLKYNEYKPAVNIDKLIIKEGEAGYGPWWVGYGFLWDRIPKITTSRLVGRIKGVVDKLHTESNGKSWVMKDPRLCVLSNKYLPLLANPICVIVVRSPLEVAHRMLSYNRANGALSVKEWAEVWEEYMVSAIRNCEDNNAQIVIAHFDSLNESPFKFASNLHQELTAIGVTDITKLSESEVEQELGHDYVSKHNIIESNAGDKLEDGENKDLLSPRAHKVWAALKESRLDFLDSASLQGPSWTAGKNTHMTHATADPTRGAYVTMVTADDKGYIAGAVVLGATIRKFDSQRDMIAMISVEVVEQSTIRTLKYAGWTVQRVDKLEEPWYERHPRCGKFNAGQKIRWGRMFSKLRLWTLPYDKVVYIDTDAILLKPIDDYFTLPGPFYAERSPSHKGINAGIIVATPSEVTLESMIDHARQNEPLQIFAHNQVGCTEQELLNQYWRTRESMTTKLNNTRHADFLSKRFTEPVGRDELMAGNARIAHWITTKCPKPWAIKREDLQQSQDGDQQLRHTPIIPKNCDPAMYELWHSYYWSLKGSTFFDQSQRDLPPGLQSD